MNWPTPTSGGPVPAAVKAIQTHALHEGVLFLSAGATGSVVRFLPSLVITDEQIHEGMDVLTSALDSL